MMKGFTVENKLGGLESKHSNYVDAKKEAQRLAKQSGETFWLYRWTGRMIDGEPEVTFEVVKPA